MKKQMIMLVAAFLYVAFATPESVAQDWQSKAAVRDEFQKINVHYDFKKKARDFYDIELSKHDPVKEEVRALYRQKLDSLIDEVLAKYTGSPDNVNELRAQLQREANEEIAEFEVLGQADSWTRDKVAEIWSQIRNELMELEQHRGRIPLFDFWKMQDKVRADTVFGALHGTMLSALIRSDRELFERTYKLMHSGKIRSYLAVTIEREPPRQKTSLELLQEAADGYRDQVIEANRTLELDETLRQINLRLKRLEQKTGL